MRKENKDKNWNECVSSSLFSEANAKENTGIPISGFSLSTYSYTSYENLGYIPNNPYKILAQKIMNGEYIPVNGIKLS